MNGVIFAIFIGAIIIAAAINSNNKDNSSDYESLGDYDSRSDDDIRKEIIEDGLKEGKNAKEISENAWFKTEERVLFYIDKYSLSDKYNKLMEERNNNPNLPTEIAINEVKERLVKEKKDLEEYKDNFDLAKETHNFEEAKSNKDMIKYAKDAIDRYEQELKALRSKIT